MTASRSGSHRAPTPGLWIAFFFLFCAVGTATAPAAAQGTEATGGDAVQERLRARIETAGLPARLVVGESSLHSASALPTFYEARTYRPGWVDPNGVRPAGRRLVAVLSAADREGLRPEDYHLATIRDLMDRVGAASPGQGPDPRLLAELELVLSDAFLIYADHLVGGRVDPVTLHSDWVPSRRDVDLVASLERALAEGEVRGVLEDLLPPQQGYRQLRTAYRRHREMAEDGGWPTVPDGPRLQVGDSGDRVVALARRLRATGELPVEAGSSSDTAFDSALDSAVRRFQRRHGLEDDGVVGPATLSALNVSAADRARQIRVNMERWRWLPQSLGDRHVRVNAADFDLDVVEEGEVVLSMRAIVGRNYRRTPVMSDRITYLVFSPFWHVPHSLAVQDQLPLQKKDPGYFPRMGFRVFRGWDPAAQPVDPATIDWSQLTPRNFPYRLRQDPGPQNALGRVKFMFPNRFSVYLHDTPGRDLFAKRSRDFSSGCIRVERASELARYLLRGAPRWTPETIQKAMHAGTEETARLPEPVPVHLLYWTAWSDGESVQFRRDIYDRDGAVRTALEEAPPRPAAEFPERR